MYVIILRGNKKTRRNIYLQLGSFLFVITGRNAVEIQRRCVDCTGLISRSNSSASRYIRLRESLASIMRKIYNRKNKCNPLPRVGICVSPRVCVHRTARRNATWLLFARGRRTTAKGAGREEEPRRGAAGRGASTMKKEREGTMGNARYISFLLIVSPGGKTGEPGSSYISEQRPPRCWLLAPPLPVAQSSISIYVYHSLEYVYILGIQVCASLYL